jgi:hypothetical protein
LLVSPPIEIVRLSAIVQSFDRQADPLAIAL